MRTTVYYSAATGRQIRGSTQDRREPNLSNIAYGNILMTGSLTTLTGNVVGGNVTAISNVAGVNVNATTVAAATVTATGNVRANIAFMNRLGSATSNNVWVMPTADVAPSAGVANIIAEYAPWGTNTGNVIGFYGPLMRYIKTTLTNAELDALYGTSRLLVPAPGGSSYNVIHSVTLVFTGGSVAWTPGAGSVTVQYDSTAGAGGTAATSPLTAATFFNAGAGVINRAVLIPVAISGVHTLTTNKGLYLTLSTADMTGGTGSSLDVHVCYSVQS